MTKEDIKRINSQYLDDTESTFEMEEVFELAIKALEQEPVIDKIRAEIEEVQTYDGIYIDRAYVLQILDKYKAESEDKE